MAGSVLDSKAVFLARCRSAGIPDDDIKALAVVNVDTMAKMGFVCSCQPGVGDDAPFVSFLVRALGRADDTAFTDGELASFRRLWWECNTVAISDVRARVERTEDSQPRKLPVPERAERLRTQQARLVGVVISGVLEPSHSLLDFCNQMRDDEVLRYVNPNRCSTRAAELLGVKKENFMAPNSQGALMAVSVETPTMADLNGEYRVRLALQRRSLALDQVNLISYSFGESYHNFLFALMSKVVPPTHRRIGLDQILLADEQIWAAMTEHCREGISMRSDSTKPMEVAMTLARSDPIILSYLQPLPSGGKGSSPKKEKQGPYSPKAAGPAGKGKGGSKQSKSESSKGSSKPVPAGKGKGKDKSAVPLALRGLNRTTAAGRRLCYGYNLEGCWNAVGTENECSSGCHCCARCLGTHPLSQCPLAPA